MISRQTRDVDPKLGQHWWPNFASTSRVFWVLLMYHRTTQETRNIYIYSIHNVRPTSKTLCQRSINVIQMFRVCWVYASKNSWTQKNSSAILHSAALGGISTSAPPTKRYILALFTDSCLSMVNACFPRTLVVLNIDIF